uniref:Uncharacterized protein n=1 Tax=Meloidogyne enterolobii TaxID=390850 RepID=A0A6V7UJ47_MELEN|nr:unnamed protein product [Meloidogyne enterolobii]
MDKYKGLLFILLAHLIIKLSQLTGGEKYQYEERLDCKRIFNNDIEYIKDKAKDRLIYKDVDIPMNCEDIYSRNYFLKFPLSEAERQFPIAYAKVVYKDYRFLEAELATNYHPQNWYCFAVDSKADDIFYKNILSLSRCFPNVIVPQERFSVDSAGHGMGKAHLSCFKELIKKERKWEYLVTLQNHDIQIKTNEEMVQIFKWLDGACDAGYDFQSEAKRDRLDGLNKNLSGPSLNKRFNEQGLPLKLSLASGNIQASLARPFVEFIVNKLDLTTMLEQLDNWEYAGDEFFIQTLLASDDLKAPNAFTHKCIDQKINVPYVTRYNIWEFEHKDKCYSNNFRHYSCVFGIEDLWHNFYNSKYLFVNKMMPEFDFGAILCWHEEMRRRTLINKGLHRLNASLYQNWPQTRFHKEWVRTNGNVDLDNFNCTN